MLVQVQQRFNKRELKMMGYDMNYIKKLLVDALSKEIINHISLEEIDDGGDYVTLRRRLIIKEEGKED